jgi:folate-binding protein YgfZ
LELLFRWLAHYARRVIELPLQKFHHALNARFGEVSGVEVVQHYGDALAEHAALISTVGLLDLSFRSRLCLTGTDRQRFLNGQVTNNVKDLKPGSGCYAALVTAKGKLQSDLNIYCLAEELLLDFEPGLSVAVADRFEKFVIADDVQVVDVAPHYGLLSVQGPKSAEALGAALPTIKPVEAATSFVSIKDSELGEVYCMTQPRGTVAGFDLFVPMAALEQMARRLHEAVQSLGGRACGWEALETIRIEAGIPRFGVDMDETNLAPETGIEGRAISYSKGCYIGQEIIARIRTYGQVAKTLRGLLLPDDLKALPVHGDKLFHDGKEVGYVTSAIASPTFRRNIALGYVRRECNQPGTELMLRSATDEYAVKVAGLPFANEP